MPVTIGTLVRRQQTRPFPHCRYPPCRLVRPPRLRSEDDATMDVSRGGFETRHHPIRLMQLTGRLVMARCQRTLSS